MLTPGTDPLCTSYREVYLTTPSGLVFYHSLFFFFFFF